MAIRIQTQMSYKQPPVKRMSRVSAVQPDMNLSIRDLIDRHSRGLSLPAHESFYDEFDPVPDLKSMDFYEQQELLIAQREETVNQKRRLNALKDAKEKLSEKLSRSSSKTTEEQSRGASDDASTTD